MYDEFINTIVELCNDVSKNIYYINSGGCCVFATMLGEKLRKYGRVYILSVGSDRTNSNLLDIKRKTNNSINPADWSKDGASFYHVVIKFHYKGKKYYIDSSGVYETPSGVEYAGKILKGWIPFQTAVAFSNDRYYWNNMFNRRQIPKMQEIIDGFDFETAFAISNERKVA